MEKESSQKYCLAINAESLWGRDFQVSGAPSHTKGKVFSPLPWSQSLGQVRGKVFFAWPFFVSDNKHYKVSLSDDHS